MLRLVTSSGEAPARTSESISPSSPGELAAEAEAIQAWHGRNAYSSFLIKNGTRPDPKQAATIGKLVGGQVQASDGTMQPPLTKAEKRLVGELRQRRSRWSKAFDQTLGLKEAVSTLAENCQRSRGLPDFVRAYLDNPKFMSELDDAVYWLNRFVEEWHNHEKQKSGDRSQSSQRDCG